MLTVDNMLAVLSFGLACLGIGFAVGIAIGKLYQSKANDRLPAKGNGHLTST